MNKTFFYKYLFILLAAGSILGSCSKSFVTKDPTTAISIGDALDSSTVLQSDLNAAYASLRNTDVYGRDFPVIGDLMADNTFLEADNTGRYIQQYGYSVPITDAVTDSMWARPYDGIQDCNQIIDAKASGSATIQAQAYALRALLYFKLVNIFATPYVADSSAMGVPLVLHYDPTALPARVSVGTVYAQIVSDLNAALAGGPSSLPYSNSVTLSYYAIEGLLAKAYMYMGNYTAALTAAQDVINNGGFTLVTANNFLSFWADAGVHSDQVEVMFEVDCDAINNNGFDDLGGIFINGYQDIYCSSQLEQLFSPSDVRLGLLIYGEEKGGDSAYLINKYPSAEQADRDNPKVIRLAEVYLIAAECENRLADDGDAKTFVNAVAEARDLSFTGYTDAGATLLADIAQERRKELAFEGDRLYDMNRLGLTINRAQNPGEAAGPLMIAYPSDERVAPIPQQETLRNAAVQQNPGY